MILILAIGSLSGCGGHRHTPADEPAADPKASIPGKLTGDNWRIRWRARDADHPDIPPRPVLDADAASGVLDDLAGVGAVTLKQVRATLYRAGDRAALIRAPRIRANENAHKVVADGGVTLTSLTVPPDSVVTADRVTWDVSSSVITAVGNARLTRLPHDGSLAYTESGGKITFDTRLNEFAVE